MANVKDNETLEPQTTATATGNAPEASEITAASAPTNQERMLANLRKKYPDIENDDDLYGKAMEGYDAEHDYAKQSRNEANQLAGIINEYPEVAGFYSELSAGNVGAAILNIGDLVDAYRNGDIDDEGYKARIAERKKADEDAAAAEEEKNGKIAAQDEVFKAWCEKHGYDPEEWMNKATEQLFKPMSSYAMAEAQFDALDKMLNYDEDVEAAEVRGRNTNISAQRRKAASSTDGQLNRSSAAAGAGQPKQENPLARMASRGAAARNL